MSCLSPLWLLAFYSALPFTMETRSSMLPMNVLRLSEVNRPALESDVQVAIDRCVASHCERVWRGLPAQDREELRRRVWNDGISPITSALLLDQRCIGEISQIIQELGCFPPETIEQSQETAPRVKLS